MKISILIACLALVLDQLSKWYVLTILHLDDLSSVLVVPPILFFTIAWNRGADFGVLSSDFPMVKWLWIGLAAAISIGLLNHYRSNASKITKIGVGLIVGGALSNATDRLVYGAVLDFLNFQLFWVHNPYSFNLADAFIFIGVGLLTFSMKSLSTSGDMKAHSGS